MFTAERFFFVNYELSVQNPNLGLSVFWTHNSNWFLVLNWIELCYLKYSNQDSVQYLFNLKLKLINSDCLLRILKICEIISMLILFSPSLNSIFNYQSQLEFKDSISFQKLFQYFHVQNTYICIILSISIFNWMLENMSDQSIKCNICLNVPKSMQEILKGFVLKGH